jgi:hypothetical protein
MTPATKLKLREKIRGFLSGTVKDMEAERYHSPHQASIPDGIRADAKLCGGWVLKLTLYVEILLATRLVGKAQLFPQTRPRNYRYIYR